MGKPPELPDDFAMAGSVRRELVEHRPHLCRSARGQLLEQLDRTVLKEQILGMLQRQVEERGLERVELPVEARLDCGESDLARTKTFRGAQRVSEPEVEDFVREGRHSLVGSAPGTWRRAAGALARNILQLAGSG